MPSGAADIFGAFLRLGLGSFGGPIAHLGYLRREFVERRRWLDDAQFAQLLSISQFLPGPASSQLGFSIGLLRGGWLGAIAAFVGFTLPSALLLFALAAAGATLGGAYWTAVVHGLKLVAVVVVADGVWRMARQLAPDWPRRAIAIAAAALVLALATASAQLLAIAAAAL
ncbi:MAG TPA: chromate transporter, partial [Gemmatimonadaceae bacterium]|nr:chromate transporter [Gemmatimonadaceae bacterium]